MAAKLPSEFVDLIADLNRVIAILEKSEALSRDMRKRLVSELEAVDHRLNDVIDHLANRT